MRFLRKILRPKYFFVLSIACFLAFPASFVLNWREQISRYHVFSWSPDGTRLAFIAEEDNSAYEIFVIDADGRNPVKLTSQIQNTVPELRWSADDETLYYGLSIWDGTTGSWEQTWYEISLKPKRFSFDILGQQGTLDYPHASQESIDASIETDNASDRYYAKTVCNDPRFYNSNYPIDECEKTLEVYSVETDELVWSFGEQRYNWTSTGILAYFHPINLLILFFTSVGLSILSLSLELPEKPDNRKPKEKRS